MAGLFDLATEQLELQTDFNRLEARGTLRLALKKAGLEVKSLSLVQVTAVFEKLMPDELRLRGIEAAESACRSIVDVIVRTADPADRDPVEGVDDIFRRLGGQ